jgi:hypothetical protein
MKTTTKRTGKKTATRWDMFSSLLAQARKDVTDLVSRGQDPRFKLNEIAGLEAAMAAAQ